MDKNLIIAALLESPALRERAADLLLANSVEPVDPDLQGRVDSIVDGARIIYRHASNKIAAIKLLRSAFRNDKKAVTYLRHRYPFAFTTHHGSDIGLAAAKYIVESL